MKSLGNPVPVKCSSSHEPSARWCARQVGEPACDRRVGGGRRVQRRSGPRPSGRGSSRPGRSTPGRRSSRRSRPSPPSGFWCSARKATARRAAGRAHVLARRRERGQRGAGAVDVVDAPAAPPRAVGALGAPEVGDAASHRRIGARHAALDEGLDDVGRHVLGGRVDHLAEVAQRELGHDPPVVVDVEGAPAAVRALHREQPVDAPADGRVRAADGRRGAARSAPRRCRRCPGTTRSRTRTTSRPARPRRGHDAPVADAGDLLREHPVARRVAAPGRPGRRPRRRARPPRGRCPRPATGRPGCAAARRRRGGARRCRRSPRSPSRITGWSSGSPSAWRAMIE